MRNNKDFGIVIVFYNPTRENIDNAISLCQKYNVVIVDNTDHIDCVNEKDIFESIGSYHPLLKNVGIAKALNIGIDDLIKKEIKYAMLLDQDSVPEAKMIDELLSLMYFHEKNKCCLVAPAYFDKSMERVAPFMRIEGNRIIKCTSENDNICYVDFVITSGSLLSLSHYQKIGKMDERLFIDLVDTEWCLRARKLGYCIIGAYKTVMEHEIGGKAINVLGKKIPNHSPLRHYYYFRNSIFLMKMKHIPKAFKINELVKLVPRFMVYSIFTQDRLIHFKCMCKGILDGVFNKTGKI